MTTTFTAAAGSEVNEAAERCPNCGAELSGKFCTACGQKRIDRRDLSVRRFFGHVLTELTHLHSNKLLGTFSALLFKPGLLTSEYLAGKKGLHIGPVRLYLTFSALYFLFAWGVLADVRGGSIQRTSRNPMVRAMAQRKNVEPLTLAERIHKKAEKIAGVLRFASVLVSGGFLALLFFKLKKYYVEHLIFSLHYYSFDFFCKTVFAFLYVGIAALGTKIPTMLLNFFYPVAFIYLVFALRRVYRQSWPWTLLKALILFACETALFIAVNIAGFFAAFALA